MKKSASESKSQTVMEDEKAEILGLGINYHIFAWRGFRQCWNNKQ